MATVIMPFPPEKEMPEHGDSDTVKIVSLYEGAADEDGFTIGQRLSGVARSIQGPLVFVGGPALLPIGAWLRMVLFFPRHITLRRDGDWRTVSILSLGVELCRNAFADRAERWGARHPLVKTLAAFRGLFRRNPKTERASRSCDGIDDGMFEAILEAVPRTGEKDRCVANRVVHVNAGLAMGGTERQICLTLEGLVASGLPDIHFLAERSDVPGLDFMRPELTSSEVRVGPSGTGRRVWRDGLKGIDARLATALAELPPQMLYDVLRLRDSFNAVRPEIVHGWQDGSNVRAGLAAAIQGVPRIVLSMRNLAPPGLPTFRSYLRPAYRALLARGNVVAVCNSYAGAKSYAGWLGEDVERFRVIHNAVDTQTNCPLTLDEKQAVRRELEIDADAPVIVGAFRLISQKRPELWIEAAAKISMLNDAAHFVLMGDGALRGKVLDGAARVLPPARFHYIGARHDVARIAGCADILLHTSEFEGLSNTLLEGHAAQLAIVCTDAGGSREVVQNGVTGTVVERGDADSLARAVVGLLDDPAALGEMGRKGRRSAVRNFAVPGMIKATLDAYRSAED